MEFLCAAPRGLIGADGGEDSLLSRGGVPNRSVDNGTEMKTASGGWPQ
jgi:hypothetical protein